MGSAQEIAFVALWILVLCLLGAFLVLARLVGTLYRRIPPRIARFGLSGPEIDSVVPKLQLKDVAGRDVTVPSTDGLSVLLVTVSPRCKTCATLIPVLRSLSRSENRDLQVVLVDIGRDSKGTELFILNHHLDGVPVVQSDQLPETYRLTGAPFAILIDGKGLVKAKGIVNHREDIESLFYTRRIEDPLLKLSQHESLSQETQGARRTP